MADDLRALVGLTPEQLLEKALGMAGNVWGESPRTRTIFEAALSVQLSKTAERVNRRMLQLTWAIAALTLIIVVIELLHAIPSVPLK